jgi:tRNA G46 methylase TrmB
MARLRGAYPRHLCGVSQRGELAVDVGVNAGHHLAQIAQAVGLAGKVIGVEAYGPMCKALLGNVDNL